MEEKYKEARAFLIDAGVAFPVSYRDHRHCLSITIDDRQSKPIIITPFSFAMSRKSLAKLYDIIQRDETSSGMKRISLLIRVMNDLIKLGFQKGYLLSHNIETGRYNLKAIDVLKIFFEISSHALKTSCGIYRIQHLGDVYSALGGSKGCYSFFYECMKATEASIPSFEDPYTELVIGYLPEIRCYTCKYCSYKNKRRICKYASVEVSGDDLKKHPHRYKDAEYDPEEGDALYSSVIDERMIGCEDYQPRIR